MLSNNVRQAKDHFRDVVQRTRRARIRAGEDVFKTLVAEIFSACPAIKKIAWCQYVLPGLGIFQLKGSFFLVDGGTDENGCEFDLLHNDYRLWAEASCDPASSYFQTYERKKWGKVPDQLIHAVASLDQHFSELGDELFTTTFGEENVWIVFNTDLDYIVEYYTGYDPEEVEEP